MVLNLLFQLFSGYTKFYKILYFGFLEVPLVQCLLFLHKVAQ